MGQSFRTLAVWQRGIELTVAAHKFTSVFPDTEKFGLTNQMRRAAVSIASNIAEGYLQFLGHARGSCSEVETQIVIARELGFGSKEQLRMTEALCSEVGRMPGAMMKSLRTKSLVPSP